jgi:hypothetical protein
MPKSSQKEQKEIELSFDQQADLIKRKYELLVTWVHPKKIKNRLKIYRKCLKKKNETTYHHVFPKSLYPERPYNKVPINKYTHIKYHSLFNNKDPYEILDFLTKECWGNKDIVKEYVKKYE